MKVFLAETSAIFTHSSVSCLLSAEWRDPVRQVHHAVFPQNKGTDRDLQMGNFPPRKIGCITRRFFFCVSNDMCISSHDKENALLIRAGSVKNVNISFENYI
jgi:hypothetical protein